MAIHNGHRDRLRNKILKNGIASFYDHEILEYLLFAFIPRKDTNEIAHNLLKEFGSLSKVLEADAQYLMQIKGMTENASIFLSSLPAMSSRYYLDKGKATRKISSVADCKAFAIEKLSHLKIEEVHIAFLDNSLGIIKEIMVDKGIVNEANFFIRDITSECLKHNAGYIILMHNHPNGSSMPSFEDKQSTQQIAVALNLVKTLLLDHIIVGKDDAYSFKASGELDNFYKASMVKLEQGKVTSYDKI